MGVSAQKGAAVVSGRWAMQEMEQHRRRGSAKMLGQTKADPFSG